MSLTLLTETIELFSQPGIGGVEEAIAPFQAGWVRFQGTYWSAQFFDSTCVATVLPKEQVIILGRQGNTLLVAPIGDKRWHQEHVSDRDTEDLSNNPLTIAEWIRTVYCLLADWFNEQEDDGHEKTQ